VLLDRYAYSDLLEGDDYDDETNVPYDDDDEYEDED